MKTLYLNRHAKSSWNDSTASDIARKLNKRGNLNAAFMAERFAQEVDKLSIVTSPAVRAESTARYFSEAMQLDEGLFSTEDRLYHDDASGLLGFINSLDDGVDAYMFFGHNPSLSQLAYELDHSFGDHMVTCSRVKLCFYVDSWAAISRDSASIQYHDYPKRHPEMQNL